ncbi:hypothetical protein BofuT4_uP011110.1 [Botrytis cinerea T4]|uniref:Uncharacterized protein n=1 Tax=Botryotinia fuckeliana (strain T4) TaxID=999810 RepID=G2XTE9_BOTF4|nr:hypothetical protein BofuT4_uP011110.1 [Botrytis cinerea T4]
MDEILGNYSSEKAVYLHIVAYLCVPIPFSFFTIFGINSDNGVYGEAHLFTSIKEQTNQVTSFPCIRNACNSPNADLILGNLTYIK